MNARELNNVISATSLPGFGQQLAQFQVVNTPGRFESEERFFNDI